MKRFLAAGLTLALLAATPSVALATTYYNGGSAHCTGSGQAFNIVNGTSRTAEAETSFLNWSDPNAICDWIKVDMKYNYGCNGYPYVCHGEAIAYAYPTGNPPHYCGYSGCSTGLQDFAIVTAKNAQCISVQFTWSAGEWGQSPWFDCTHAGD